MSTKPFPIGSRFGDGEYQIIDRLRGIASAGQYIAIGPRGTCLVTLARHLSIGHAEATRLFALPVDGVARVTYLGPLEGSDEGDAIDAIAETMPGGRPTSLGVPAEHVLVLAAHAAVVAARAHQLTVVLGGLRPEFIFWEDHPARISGFTPCGERFIALAGGPRDVGGYPFTQVFSAPEQISGGAATQASDVFTLATTIATWFGRHPFGEMIPTQVRAIMRGTPQLDHVPAPVSALLTRALVVVPQDRLTMRELADGFRELTLLP